MRIKREFTVKQFRQLIGVAPSYYNHKWDARSQLVVILPEHVNVGSIEPRKAHFRSIIAQSKELLLGQLAEKP